MSMKVRWKDEATPWLKWAADELPELRKSVLKSAGFQMKKQMERGVRAGSPAGKPYPKGAPPRVRKAFDRALGNEPKSRYRPLGRMVSGRNSLLRYNAGSDFVEVGWIGGSAEYYGRLMEEGFRRKLSPKLRAKLHKEGVHIPKARTHIEVKPRETIGPYQEFYQRNVGGVANYMEEVIWHRLQTKRKMPASQAAVLWGRYCGR
jgi:hypothetical protein